MWGDERAGKGGEWQGLKACWHTGAGVRRNEWWGGEECGTEEGREVAVESGGRQLIARAGTGAEEARRAWGCRWQEDEEGSLQEG